MNGDTLFGLSSKVIKLVILKRCEIWFVLTFQTIQANQGFNLWCMWFCHDGGYNSL